MKNPKSKIQNPNEFQIPNSKLKALQKKFGISLKEMKRIIGDFHCDMEKGLAGRKSSLKMIPTHVNRPTGAEKGKFIALDLGGTNFRILELELKGLGRSGRIVSKSFTLDRKYLSGSGEELFGFIAGCVKAFLKRRGTPGDGMFDLGFTFSFPVEQTGIASGRLLRWTKGFRVRGVVGNDVVKLLNDALVRKGVENVRVAALANDTVGTLVAKAYEDPDCDTGVIIGTGTNACYAGMTHAGPMIINTEWGNFNKLKANLYDRRLDEGSDNPGSQVLEKMVSGMYLGELFRLVACDIMKKKFSAIGKLSFKTEYMSRIQKDRSAGMRKTAELFKKLGIRGLLPEEKRLTGEICRLISVRSSRISAAALAAVITKMDPGLSRDHTVAIDGSVYEKYPGFSQNIKKALKEIFRDKARRITISLAKDGSGRGAAVIAAVANPA